MSRTAAPSLSPAWLDQLAPDAILMSSVLRRSLHGRDAIVKVVQAAAKLYEAHSVKFSAKFGDKELLEYDAQAF